MKLLSYCRVALVLLGVGLGLVGCGGSDTVDPCTPLAASTPASGASAAASSTGAYLCAAGVGVADLEASVSFYKRAFAMTERARIQRADRNEVVLDSADGRGSRLVLMNFTDGSTRNYRQNPGKIVFYVKDAPAVAAAFTAAGGVVSSPPRPFGTTGVVVGFGRDRDNNLVEIASLPATDPKGAQTHSYLSAFGVGVSDLESAKAFYVNTLGMTVSQYLAVTKPTATGGTTPWYNEYILVSNTGRGSAVVLMTYTDGIARNYANNPVKLSLRSTDPQAYAAAIAAAGKPVTTAPKAGAEGVLGDTVIGFARDADGTVLELLDSPN